MDKQKYLLALEKEILDEEGLFAPPDIFEDPDHRYDKCMYCGYDIIRSDERVQVNATGDTIHRTCWQDYAEDSINELCTMLG